MVLPSSGHTSGQTGVVFAVFGEPVSRVGRRSRAEVGWSASLPWKRHVEGGLDTGIPGINLFVVIFSAVGLGVALLFPVFGFWWCA